MPATTDSAALDNHLIARIQHHDEPALALLYDRYSRLVYGVALHITGDRQTTEEVVQDVFQTVWQNGYTFQPCVASCLTWLMSITRHRAIDAVRSKRERARTHEQALSATLPLGDEHQPAYEVERRLVHDDIRAALHGLPTNQRQAIELAYYGGLTCREIAERLGAPVGTIKTRLRLGLHKVRDALMESECSAFEAASMLG